MSIRTHVRRVAAGLLVVSLALAGGCQKKNKTTTIIDDSAIRMDEAKQLAAKAIQEQKLAEEARANHDEKGWNTHSTEAIKLYQQALAKSKEMFLAWNNVGMLLMERQSYMDAAECFKSAADLSADDPRPYYNIGVIYQQTLHDKEALEYFLMSLARDSRYLPSLRGATASGKRLDVTDEAALKRVRTALLIETDPRWRSIFETETLRIEGSLQRAGKSTTGL
jgi:tetratricopeptide (TPR) repeat protein